MNNSMISSMVAMQGLQQKLDVIANNMANVDTVGFKRKEAAFQDVLTSIVSQPDGFLQDGRLTPLGLTQGWGARVSQIQMRMDQGTLQQTDQSSDLAIEGDGLFEVSLNTLDADGVLQGGAAWTRNGAFHYTVLPGDPQHTYLSTSEGHLVRGVDDQPIRIPQGYELNIDTVGNIQGYNAADPNNEPLQLGQLKIVRILRPQALESIGDNLFVLPADVNNDNGEIVQTIDLGAVEDTANTIAIRQGFLEQSNVELADEMTQLIAMQRAYQLSSRALVSADSMMALANNLRS